MQIQDLVQEFQEFLVAHGWERLRYFQVVRLLFKETPAIIFSELELPLIVPLQRKSGWDYRQKRAQARRRFDRARSAVFFLDSQILIKNFLVKTRYLEAG